MATNPPLNLGGLASGLDTNSIIDQLMSIERQPEVRLKMRQATENARQQALRDVQTKLQTLSDAANALEDPGLWANKQTVDVNDTTKLTATYVSGAGPGGYEVNVSQLARASQHWFTYTPPAGADTLTVGGHQFNLTAGEDINSLASQVNSDSTSPVYASVVTSGGSQYIVFSSRTTGAASDFTTTGASVTENAGKAVAGLDAQYSINGGALTSSATNVVTDAIPGLSLTLKGTTTVSGPVSVTVGAPAPDEGAVSDKVKAFVDAYNGALTFIQGKLQEKPVFNPQNATDAAKGVLYSDSGLESLMSSLRNSITGTYAPGNPSTLDQLMEVGVSTGAAVGSGALNQDSIAGKLTFDATAFATAFAGDSVSVKSLLQGASGFAQAFEGILAPTVQSGGVLDQRISDEDNVKSSLADQIAAMDQNLQLKQDSLKKQFAAMEQALSQSQSEGQWLQGQLAGLPR